MNGYKMLCSIPENKTLIMFPSKYAIGKNGENNHTTPATLD